MDADSRNQNYSTQTYLANQAEAAMWPTPNVPSGGRTANTTNYRTDGSKQQADLGAVASLWATPRVTEAHGAGEHGDGGPDLRTQVALWQTPATDSFRSRGGERVDEAGLDQQARMWRTPDAGSNRNVDIPSKCLIDGTARSDQQVRLADQAYRHSLPHPTTPTDGEPSSNAGPNSRRRLNPLFVEWLMGWPIGWTSLAPLGSGSRATASSPSRLV